MLIPPHKESSLMEPIPPRTLTPDDAAAYREIRLRSLQDHPEAFGSSYEEEVEVSAETLAERWRAAGDSRTNFGAFVGMRLVGIVTLNRYTAGKLRHRGYITGMYVDGSVRSQGVGLALIDVAITCARQQGIEELTLAVTAGNDSARRLYRRCGFVSYGVEPNLIRANGRDYDVEFLWRKV
jgi:ribosomal protein S18 acetylase RimI-like enzyme